MQSYYKSTNKYIFKLIIMKKDADMKQRGICSDLKSFIFWSKKTSVVREEFSPHWMLQWKESKIPGT